MKNKSQIKILIDNGHGVSTQGKRSPDGRLREYKYCREIAQAVVGRLKAKGYDATLLVPEDADISLSQRCARANSWCAKKGNSNVLLVSVHNNAAGMGDKWMSGRGWEAWTSKGPTQADKLAECLYDAAIQSLPKGTPIRTDMADGDRDKESNFTILYDTKCPAVLTENLFQDNLPEVEYLLSAKGRESIIALHVEGIEEFLKSKDNEN